LRRYATQGLGRPAQFFEQQVPFLVHLLAHHPDFSTSEIGTFKPIRQNKPEGDLTPVQIEALQENEVRSTTMHFFLFAFAFAQTC